MGVPRHNKNQSSHRRTGVKVGKKSPPKHDASSVPVKTGQRPKSGLPAPKTVHLPEPLKAPEKPTPPSEKERGSYDGDTAIKLYLREIGLVNLLTPQEEIELAARIKKGDKKAR